MDWFAAIYRGCYHHRYQLFPDGTAWCVVWLILADPSMASSAGAGQQATVQEGVIIIGAYTRGFTFAQLEAFMSLPAYERPSLTLTSQWQPEFEHSLG